MKIKSFSISVFLTDLSGDLADDSDNFKQKESLHNLQTILPVASCIKNPNLSTDVYIADISLLFPAKYFTSAVVNIYEFIT